MAGTSWPTLVAGAKAKASEVEAKLDWIEQDIVPMIGGIKTDATYDLGTSSFRWRDGYFSRQIQIGDGSVGAPSLAQNSAVTNGIYFPNSARVGVTNPLVVPNGAVGAPTLSFANSPTTGFYRPAADAIAAASAGVETWRVSSAGEITAPLQPSFLAWSSGNTVGTTTTNYLTTIPFSTEVLDRNGDFTTSGIFTAPVTGIYHFDVVLYVTIDNVSTTRLIALLETTGRTFVSYLSTREATISADHGLFISVAAPMTAGDTAVVKVNGNAGTGFNHVTGSTSSTLTSYFSGFLIC